LYFVLRISSYVIWEVRHQLLFKTQPLPPTIRLKRLCLSAGAFLAAVKKSRSVLILSTTRIKNALTYTFVRLRNPKATPFKPKQTSAKTEYHTRFPNIKTVCRQERGSTKIDTGARELEVLAQVKVQLVLPSMAKFKWHPFLVRHDLDGRRYNHPPPPYGRGRLPKPWPSHIQSVFIELA